MKWFDDIDRWLAEDFAEATRLAELAAEEETSYAAYDSQRFDSWQVGYDHLGAVLPAARRLAAFVHDIARLDDELGSRARELLFELEGKEAHDKVEGREGEAK